VRRARRRLGEVGPSSEREAGDFARVALPEGDADVLRDLLIAERARVVIEVGLAYGSSALAIGEALLSQPEPGATHLIIDAYQEHFANCLGHEVRTLQSGVEVSRMVVTARLPLEFIHLPAPGEVGDGPLDQVVQVLDPSQRLVADEATVLPQRPVQRSVWVPALGALHLSDTTQLLVVRREQHSPVVDQWFHPSSLAGALRTHKRIVAGACSSRAGAPTGEHAWPADH
jgi:hypothetical protein